MTTEDRAIAFVLGALSPEEREEVTRLRLYDSALDQEIRMAEHLYARMQDEEPAAALRTPLWDRIQQAVAAEQAALAGNQIEECSDGDWQQHNSLIDMKNLWSDKAILIRCNPGGIEEAHEQPSDEDEHIIVVAGDLNIGGRVFRTGDYIRVPAGSMHSRMSSNTGCILFTEYRTPESISGIAA